MPSTDAALRSKTPYFENANSKNTFNDDSNVQNKELNEVPTQKNVEMSEASTAATELTKIQSEAVRLLLLDIGNISSFSSDDDQGRSQEEFLSTGSDSESEDEIPSESVFTPQKLERYLKYSATVFIRRQDVEDQIKRV